MENDEINYKILRKIQELEKTSPSLTKINKDFYIKLSEYIKNLEKINKDESNPNKKKLFNSEIENTKRIALNIYELREKKIVQAALSKVRGGKPDLKNILNIETKLFESLAQQIIVFRQEILKKRSKTVDNGKVIQKESKKNGREINKNPIVRVLENIPDFVGTDMKTYSLRKNDVLTISNEMYEPLVKSGVIKEIK